MKKVTVIALKPHPYEGIPRKVGQRYEADEKFVQTLTVTGLCKLADEPVHQPAPQPSSNPPKKGKLNTRHMGADK